MKVIKIFLTQFIFLQIQSFWPSGFVLFKRISLLTFCYFLVNDVNFEDMGNAEAVEFLRKVVQEPGPLTLTIAKCWDPSPHPMNPYNNHQSQAMSHPPGGGDRNRDLIY